MGDTGKDAERLFYENRGLVYGIVNEEFPFTNDPMIDRDDLIQTGELALWRAAAMFDPDRGSFANYAGRAIRNAIIDLLGDSTGQRPDGTEYAEDETNTYSYGSDPEDIGEWLEEIGDNFDEAEREQIVNTAATECLFDEITSQHDPELLRAIQMKGEGCTWREIAESLGFANHSSLQNRALKLQNELKEKYGNRWDR